MAIALWLGAAMAAWTLFTLFFRSRLGLSAWGAMLVVTALTSAWLTARSNLGSPAWQRVAMAALSGLLFLPVLGVLILLATPMRLFVTPTNSMVPTLQPGALLVVDMHAYRDAPPVRGDIVLFRSPLNASLRLLKRVVALEGERIAVRAGEVYVDGHRLDEPYLRSSPTARFSESQPTTVPERRVFVLGDNRAASFDSRFLGAIPNDLLDGRVCYTLPVHLEVEAANELAVGSWRP